MIKSERLPRGKIRDKFIRQTITGKIDDILYHKTEIKLEDILGSKRSEKRREKVLIEGAPGCGKSTLSLHLCQLWADGQLFQRYNLVVLVRLRDPVVLSSRRIADVLPRCDEAMGLEIEELIVANCGKDVLFVLDGWDELPKNTPVCSVISYLIQGAEELFRKSSVIVTSRPTSSAVLHKLISTRIEVLGFTNDEVRRYFEGCLEGDTESVEILLQRIKQNPVVEGTCSLPLNASILVHLFKCEGNALPITQYGIFSGLICNCIRRHIRKTRHEDVEIKSLDQLPSGISEQFQVICELAYNGVMNDVVIFELESDFNTLGLLQGVESFSLRGKSHSYNFLHLSIQEVLSALYIATKFKAHEQVEQFRKLFDQSRFSAVFQFYAAYTKLQTPGIQNVVAGAATSEDIPRLLSLFNCLYEAQDTSLCQSVLSQLKFQLDLRKTSLNRAECCVLGYILTHAKDFQVNLNGCRIGDGCNNLLRQDKVYPLKELR